MYKNNSTSPAKKRIGSFISKRFPGIDEKEITTLTSDLVRFVKVVQKIYTEPQYQIQFKKRRKANKTDKPNRIFNTDMVEIMKVCASDDPNSLQEAIKNFTNQAIKKESDKRRK